MFRDTSMDYLPREEVLEIWNNNMRLTDEHVPIIPWRFRYMPPHIATRN